VSSCEYLHRVQVNHPQRAVKNYVTDVLKRVTADACRRTYNVFLIKTVVEVVMIESDAAKKDNLISEKKKVKKLRLSIRTVEDCRGDRFCL